MGQIFCIRLVLEYTRWEKNGTLHQLFVDLQQAYNLSHERIYVQYSI